MYFGLKLYYAKFEIRKEMGSDEYIPGIGVKKCKGSFFLTDLKMP